MEKLQIGNIIRATREACGVSREELAHRIGVATTTVYRWERDQQAPKFTDIVLVSKALDRPIASFAGEVEMTVSPPSGGSDLAPIFQTLAKHARLIELMAQLDDDILETFESEAEALLRATKGIQKSKKA